MESVGGISGLLAMSGSVCERDLAALVPDPGEARRAVGQGKPFRRDQRTSGLFRACLSPGSLSFRDEEQPRPSLQSPSVPGKRMEGRKGWSRS